MAYIYKGLDGKKMSEIIASLDEVQGEIWERTFEIAARAEALLVQHRVEGIAKIDMAKGDIDAYVVLEDTNKTNARKSNNSAASIELGRGGYTVEVVDERGKVVNEYEVAPAEGLHILTEASHLPKRSRGLRAATEKRVKVKQRKRGGGRG
ncbi:hypothetical protein SEA_BARTHOLOMEWSD_15 [Streptomyces phage BartholomewSD]|uniref:Uncharacterized protein n=1 Tax=Streptomyces phage Alvy TaxID=2599888 RepID=A0A5J6TR22_9CAUD|nr:tail completion or Neck1 protein [Streptomyces phage Alvy]QAX95465.1 hypothetical protein SEA_BARTHOLOMEWSD_15 [Streptomyces phage BartholomewSD]QFG12427.1 hypothetical protein SEA_ALVY_15 [Streptomyces phage Alvy]